jgi:hypothetical protein
MKKHPALLKIFIIFSASFLWPPNGSSASVLINELVAASSQTDEFGTSLDWIELINVGSQEVDLTNYSLTDDPLAPRKWIVPTLILPPGNVLLVWATGYGFYNPGEYHTNFRLRREGEFLALYDSEFRLLDSLTYPAQYRDVSFGRSAGDRNEWHFFSTPSPGRANGNDGKKGYASSPIVSLPGGLYANSLNISLFTADADALIFYTLDGSPPTETSARYTAPLTISKTVPLRVRAFRDEYYPSDIVTHTYLIQEPTPLPILSLVTDPPHLWDRSTGIYQNATMSGPAWERPVTAQCFSTEGKPIFSANAGLRIHGGASRQRADKKSFRLYFRGEYGPKKLQTTIIPSTSIDVFDSFILRAGYNDSWIHWDAEERRVAVYLSDQLGRDVHEDMGSVASHGTYVNLYLNGQYWGLYNLCERFDGDFLTSYYGFDEWDIINDDELKEGDTTEWNRLKTFVSRSNLSDPDKYHELLTMIDLEQVTSYYILNIWVQNHDWPHHNWYAVRERTPTGRWKLLVWDIEDSFGSGASRGSYSLNTFNQAQNSSSIGNLFAGLLKSAEYREYFLQRLEYYLNTTLNESHLLPKLDEHAALIRAAMPFEAQRWNPTKSIVDWEAALDIARTFIRQRTNYVRQYVYRALQAATPTPTPISVLPPPTAIPTTPTPRPTATPTLPPSNPEDSIGIFDGHTDIGNVQAAGNAFYNSIRNEYIVAGSGDDIWNQADECHFLYKIVNGPFSLEAQFDGTNYGTSNWVKFALMARQSLHPAAKHFAARVQESTYQASSQWRSETGASAGSTASAARIDRSRHDGRLKLVRNGNRFQTFYFSVSGQNWTLLDEQTINMTDPIYVGLAVTSHDDGNLAEGIFSEVRWDGAEVYVPHWQIH